MQNTTERKDESRITAQIVEYLEKGVRPWTRPWNAEHAAGRITRPLRFNGQPYSGINVLSLWMSALSQNLLIASAITEPDSSHVDPDSYEDEEDEHEDDEDFTEGKDEDDQ
jgi:antirestriction protein ArdC